MLSLGKAAEIPLFFLGKAAKITLFCLGKKEMLSYFLSPNSTTFKKNTYICKSLMKEIQARIQRQLFEKINGSV